MSYQVAPNKALQRTRLSAGCFPWLLVRAAELGRYVALQTCSVLDWHGVRARG